MIPRALAATFAGGVLATGWWAFWSLTDAIGDALDETVSYQGVL